MMTSMSALATSTPKVVPQPAVDLVRAENAPTTAPVDWILAWAGVAVAAVALASIQRTLAVKKVFVPEKLTESRMPVVTGRLIAH